MIDEYGIVHIVREPETPSRFGKFFCRKTYTKEKRLVDEWRLLVRRTKRRVPTCVVCLAVSFR